jgi:hypothetical protein
MVMRRAWIFCLLCCLTLSGCPADGDGEPVTEPTVIKDEGCEADSHPRLGTVTPGWEGVARVCANEDNTSIRLQNLSASVLSVVGQEWTDLRDADLETKEDPVKRAKQAAVSSSLGTFPVAWGAKLVPPEASIIGNVNSSAPEGTRGAVRFNVHTGETSVMLAATALVDWIADQLPDRPGDFADSLVECAQSAGKAVLELSNVPNGVLLARAVEGSTNCIPLFIELRRVLQSAEDEAVIAGRAATVVRIRTQPLWDDAARLLGKVGRYVG